MKTKISLDLLVCLVVAARLALPYGIQRYVNRVLGQNPDYHGHVGNVSVQTFL